MKRNKGISVISLVITIIVLIIVVSVTTYYGSKSVDQTRSMAAKSRLEAIASSVRAYEKELGYAGIITEEFSQIQTSDYFIMGLQDFADTSKYPPVLINKTIDPNDSNKKIYTLKTPKMLNKSGSYQSNDYVEYVKAFYDEETKQHLKVEFDTKKGVNRPLITSEMTPVKVSFAGNNDPLPVIVEDIYTDDWYNYSSKSPMWANMKIDSTLYVWIPRFAYKIQSFDLGKDYEDISASAIDIIFLQGTTDLMPNGEVLPSDYQVHPAFKYFDSNTNEKVDIAGFWVNKRNIGYADVLYAQGTGVSAVENSLLDSMHPRLDDTYLTSHLIKNTEWAAIAYLSHHTVGRSENGNSLNTSASGVLDLNEKSFVHAGLASELLESDYVDNYYLLSDDEISYDSYEGYSGDGYGHKLYKKFGDGTIATSTGLNDHSAWFGGTSIKLSEEKPYMIRGLDDNLFSYDATENNPERGAMYRNVIIVFDEPIGVVGN